MYLGLPVGGDAKMLSFWNYVAARIATRLSGWKAYFFLSVVV